MTRRLVLMLTVALVAAGCGSTNDDSIDPNSPNRLLSRGLYSGNETGPTPVGAIPDISLRDDLRNKDLLLSIEYPTRGGPHPVVLFSPAYGATNRAYVGLSSYWAGNGYVVIRVAHMDRGGESALTQADRSARSRDLGFVLDSLGVLEQRYPELQGKMDPARVGVAGHALGGQTALLFAADPRVKAVVALDPDTTDVPLATLQGPALFVTAALAPGVTDHGPFSMAPAGEKWLVTIEGARAPAFTGRMEALTDMQAREALQREPLEDPINGGTMTQRNVQRTSRAQNIALRMQEMFGVVRGSALAFWDTYLAAKPAGREALQKMKDRRGVLVQMK